MPSNALRVPPTLSALYNGISAEVQWFLARYLIPQSIIFGCSMPKKVCFVLMPFGRKPDANNRMIDFDAVYNQIFAPAIEKADLVPIRADEEPVHGFIHKLMYERLLVSDYALADLTILNANVYYELGIRHATREETTITAMAAGTILPFDVQALRALPYNLDAAGGLASPEADRDVLAERIQQLIDKPVKDSPLFQLLTGFKQPPLDHLRTDAFLLNAEQAHKFRDKLRAARGIDNQKAGQAEVAAIEQELGNLSKREAGVVVDLLLSYRAVGGTKQMIDLVAKMHRTVANSLMVQEQLAFAYNKEGQFDKAEQILLELIKERGRSSETNGLLGSVYKNRWLAAKKAGNATEANAFLRRAIRAYREGFEADWRDAYPGINAVTLMEVANDPVRKDILPVVQYSIQRRLGGNENSGDYWDNSTRLELAIIDNKQEEAEDALGDALATGTEAWQFATTFKTLEFLHQARSARGESVEMLEQAMHAYRPKLPK